MFQNKNQNNSRNSTTKISEKINLFENKDKEVQKESFKNEGKKKLNLNVLESGYNSDICKSREIIESDEDIAIQNNKTNLNQHVARHSSPAANGTIDINDKTLKIIDNLSAACKPILNLMDKNAITLRTENKSEQLQKLHQSLDPHTIKDFKKSLKACEKFIAHIRLKIPHITNIDHVLSHLRGIVKSAKMIDSFLENKIERISAEEKEKRLEITELIQQGMLAKITQLFENKYGNLKYIPEQHDYLRKRLQRALTSNPDSFLYDPFGGFKFYPFEKKIAETFKDFRKKNKGCVYNTRICLKENPKFAQRLAVLAKNSIYYIFWTGLGVSIYYCVYNSLNMDPILQVWADNINDTVANFNKTRDSLGIGYIDKPFATRAINYIAESMGFNNTLNNTSLCGAQELTNNTFCSSEGYNLKTFQEFSAHLSNNATKIGELNDFFELVKYNDNHPYNNSVNNLPRGEIMVRNWFKKAWESMNGWGDDNVTNFKRFANAGAEVVNKIITELNNAKNSFFNAFRWFPIAAGAVVAKARKSLKLVIQGIAGFASACTFGVLRYVDYLSQKYLKFSLNKLVSLTTNAGCEKIKDVRRVPSEFYFLVEFSKGENGNKIKIDEKHFFTKLLSRILYLFFPAEKQDKLNNYIKKSLKYWAKINDENGDKTIIEKINHYVKKVSPEFLSFPLEEIITEILQDHPDRYKHCKPGEVELLKKNVLPEYIKEDIKDYTRTLLIIVACIHVRKIIKKGGDLKELSDLAEQDKKTLLVGHTNWPKKGFNSVTPKKIVEGAGGCLRNTRTALCNAVSIVGHNLGRLNFFRNTEKKPDDINTTHSMNMQNV